MDLEFKIHVKYTPESSQDSYEHIYFNSYNELGRWIYNNWKVTIWNITII